MSTEVRRISLKSVSTEKTDNNLDKSDNKRTKDTKETKDQKTPKEPKTKRFVLDLNTDNDECNEFSFNDLIKSNDDKNGEPNGTNPGDDAFPSDEEQNLRNLEKHFQLKYGPKKRKQMEDYIDKGMGYDETDPFIDNDEAYDELVPSTLTTQYGGFYINCGELKFRPLSPDKEVEDDDEEDNIRPVLKRKRKIEMISGKRRRSSSELKAKSIKNKIPVNPGKTVAQMLQQKKIQKPNSSDNSNEIEEIELNDSDSGPLVNVSASVRDVVDSVAKGEDQPNDEERNNRLNGSLDAEDSKKDNSQVVVKLPEGIPQELTSIIDKIKNLAQTSHDGKRNFFTNDVNKLLFDIERKCRTLPQVYRTHIYSYLATHLPCSKQTLMSRAKKASLETFDYELNSAMANIRVIVKLLTPRVFEKYQRMMEEAKQSFDQNRSNGTPVDIKLPRKQFGFTQELKKQLYCAVTAKLNLYEHNTSKSQSISLKDYLYEYLDKEIKPIFPKGWMSLELLKHKVKWIKQILPPEPQQSAHPSTQSGSQTVAQSPHPTTPANQLSPNQSQSQPNKVQSQTLQTHQSSHEKLTKSQSIIIQKSNKSEMDSIERKFPSNSNTGNKSVSNTYPTNSKVNDNLSEGLVSKFMSTPKEAKDNSEAINITSIDLTTKPRSSPNTLTTSTPSARLSPINLKTSQNTTTVKSDAIKAISSSSPIVSPLAINSILQNYKSDKSEKLTTEACLTKVIEQSLGDYPNSSYTNSQRNSKITSLPQTSLPMNELFAKSFSSSNSTPSKESKQEICIDIASSPEPYIKSQPSSSQSNTIKAQTTTTQFPQQSQQQRTTQMQQKPVNKQVSISSASASNLNFLRNSELPKKKYNSSSSLIQPLNAQKPEPEVRQNVSKVEQMLIQSPLTVSNRTLSRDTSISITPVPQNKSNDNSLNSLNMSKQNTNTSSRHSNSSNVITTTSVPALNLTDPVMMNTYIRYLNQMQSNMIQNPIRFIDSSFLNQSSQSSQNHSLFYPYANTPTSTSHRTGTKDK